MSLPELRPIRADAPRLVHGLALPAYRFVGGLHPHPVRDPAGHSHGIEEPAPRAVPPDRWRECPDYLAGVDLYHQGYLWEAHERWEGLWKASTDPVQRDFLQGLIQLAAALLKVHVEQRRGARSLARAARDRLRRAAAAARTSRYMGLDLEALVASIEAGLGPVLAGRPWTRDSVWPGAPALLPR